MRAQAVLGADLDAGQEAVVHAVAARLERDADLVAAEEQAGLDELGRGCAHGEVEALRGPRGTERRGGSRGAHDRRERLRLGRHRSPRGGRPPACGAERAVAPGTVCRGRRVSALQDAHPPSPTWSSCASVRDVCSGWSPGSCSPPPRGPAHPRPPRPPTRWPPGSSTARR